MADMPVKNGKLNFFKYIKMNYKFKLIYKIFNIKIWRSSASSVFDKHVPLAECVLRVMKSI